MSPAPLLLAGAAAALATGLGRAAAERAARRSKPQRAFKSRLLDTSDAPFPHPCGGEEHPAAAAIDALIAAPPLPSDALGIGAAAAPPPLGATPLRWVASERALRAMCAELSGKTRFAVDLEHSPRAYHGITCLIQISIGGGQQRAPRARMHACAHA